MEEEEAAVAGSASPGSAAGSRGLCSGRCRRPIPVCICAALPPEPLPTATHLLLLRRPHELRHRPRPPPLPPPMRDRRGAASGLGSSPALDSLDAAPPSPFPRAAPSSSSPPSQPTSPPPTSPTSPSRHGARRRGRKVWSWWCSTGHGALRRRWCERAGVFWARWFAAQVSLGFDASAGGGSIFDDELVLRKGPFGACVSTVATVARALRLLEPNGAEVEDRLLGVLRTMVRLQAGYQKPMKPRPRLVEKGR